MSITRIGYDADTGVNRPTGRTLYTGKDSKAIALAKKASARVLEETNNAIEASAAFRKIWKMHLKARAVINDSVKYDKHSFYTKPVDHSRPQLFDPAQGPLRDIVLLTAREEDAQAQYKYNTLLGVNRGAKSARGSAYQFMLDEAKNRESIAEGMARFQYLLNQKLGVGRSSKSAAESAGVFREEEKKKTASFEEKMRAAKELHMRRVIMSAGERRKNQQDITRGIEGAFGKDGLKSLAKGFGLYYGASSIAGAIKYLLYDNPIQSALQTQRIGQTAMLAGTSIEKMSTAGYAFQTFGGGAEDAASLYDKLNQLAQSAKYGQVPEMFKMLSRRFGISYMNGGQIADADTMIRRISDKLSSTKDPGKRAFIGKTLGLSGPQLELLSRGFDEFKKATEKADVGSPYTFGGKENLKAQAESVNKLSVESDKLKKNLAASPIVRKATSTAANVLEGINSGLENSRAVGNAIKNGTYGSYDFFKQLDDAGKLRSWQRQYTPHFYETIGKNLIDYLNTKGTLKKFLDETEYLTPSRRRELKSKILPIEYPTPTIGPLMSPTINTEPISGDVNIRLDFGDIESKLSRETIDAFNGAGSMFLRDVAPQIFMGGH